MFRLCDSQALVDLLLAARWFGTAHYYKELRARGLVKAGRAKAKDRLQQKHQQQQQQQQQQAGSSAASAKAKKRK